MKKLLLLVIPVMIGCTKTENIDCRGRVCSVDSGVVVAKFNGFLRVDDVNVSRFWYGDTIRVDRKSYLVEDCKGWMEK